MAQILLNTSEDEGFDVHPVGSVGIPSRNSSTDVQRGMIMNGVAFKMNRQLKYWGYSAKSEDLLETLNWTLKKLQRNTCMDKTLTLASVLFTVIVFSGTAQAVPVMCTGGTATYPGTDPDATVDVSDVSLGSKATADDCFYDVTQGSGEATELGIINATDWATAPEFSSVLLGTADPFSFAAKDNIDPTETDVSNTVLGILWSLTFTETTSSSGSTTRESGTWVLSWTDPNPAETFPLYFDVVVLLKAASNLRMGYLFDNIALTTAPNSLSGTYEVNLINNGGNFAELSHGSLAVRAGTGPTPDPDPIPVPGTLLLLGLGLFGLRYARNSTPLKTPR